MKENPLHVVKLEGEPSTKLPCFTYMLMQDDAFIWNEMLNKNVCLWTLKDSCCSNCPLFFEVDQLVMHFFVVCCLLHFSATPGCKLYHTNWNINLPSEN